MEPHTRFPDLDEAPPAPVLPANRVRELLRRLRDLDLHAPRTSLSGGGRVQIAGCLSRDAPVETSLRYLIHVEGESDHSLEISGVEGRLELEVRERGASEVIRRVSCPLLLDPEGRATIPGIRARVHTDTTDPREVEHFLRRLVRASFARRNRPE